jgi:hypothetical protein
VVESGELTEMVRVVSRLARTDEEVSDIVDCTKQELHGSKFVFRSVCEERSLYYEKRSQVRAHRMPDYKLEAKPH